MQRTASILFDTLYTLALALWFGLLTAQFIVPNSAAPNAAYTLFVNRSSGLIEMAGVTMVAVQFLLRRRYERHRQLALADGVRQLLTFVALLLAEFGRYGLLKPGQTMTATVVSTLGVLAGAQMAVLVAITGLTSWLMLTRAAAAQTPEVKASPPPAAPTPIKQAKPTSSRKRK